MFQFTHPGGVRPSSAGRIRTFSRFQFTHPGGVRLRLGYAPSYPPLVSIHAPGRGATFEGFRANAYLPVSIHAPGRGATTALVDFVYNCGVSIHAPGRGATYLGREVTAHCGVSIHAPGRGATTPPSCQTCQSQRFNSRTREGCDGSDYGVCLVDDLFQFTHPGGVRHPARQHRE